MFKIGLFCPMDYYPSQTGGPIQVYMDIVEQVELAEALRFDSFWIAENHFTSINGVCPSPPVFLSCLFQKTRRIKMGPAVCVLPLYHPLHVAEDYALLDILSEGRLLMGIGSGFLEESFAGFQIPMQEKGMRFSESLEIIRRAWTGECFSYAGSYYSIDNVQVNVTPTAGAEMPFWVSVTKPGAIEAMARAGHSLLLSPFISNMNRASLKGSLLQIEQIFQENSAGKSMADVGVVVHVHVGLTMAAGQATGRSALERRIKSLGNGGFFPGSPQVAERMLKMAWENGLFVFGDGVFVKEQMLLLKELGVKNLLLFMHFGGVAQSDVLSSMRLFAEEVMPFLN